MTENSQSSTDDEFIPLDEQEETQEQIDQPSQPVINFNVNDAHIAKAKELYKDIDAGKDMVEAKTAKKVLTKMRTTLAEAHKDQKAESLAYGRLLDAEKNRLLELIGEVENPIKKQIDDIVNAAALADEERKGKIMAHLDRLSSYTLYRHDLDVEQIRERRANLAKEPLTEEIYEEFLPEAKMRHEEADTKLRIVLQRELDAEIEKERLAKEREELDAEKKKLAKEREEIDKENARIAKAREERDAEARKKQEERDAAKQKELDEIEEGLAAEQKRLDDIKAEDERKAAEEEERLAELAKAPDREKLILFSRFIDDLVANKPVMQSQEGANTLLFACEQLTEVADTVRKCVEEMK